MIAVGVDVLGHLVLDGLLQGPASTPEQFNRFVEEFVGPMMIEADGAIRQKQLPSAEAEGNLKSNIAGGGFEPPTSGL